MGSHINRQASYPSVDLLTFEAINTLHHSGTNTLQMWTKQN